MEVRHSDTVRIAAAAAAPVAISLVAGRILCGSWTNYLKWGIVLAPATGLLACRVERPSPIAVEEPLPSFAEAVERCEWETVRRILAQDPYLAQQLHLESISPDGVGQKVGGFTLHDTLTFWSEGDIKAWPILAKMCANIDGMPERVASHTVGQLWREVASEYGSSGTVPLTAADLAGPYSELGSDPDEVNLKLRLSYFHSLDDQALLRRPRSIVWPLVKAAAQEQLQRRPELIETALEAVDLATKRDQSLSRVFLHWVIKLIAKQDMTAAQRQYVVRQLLNRVELSEFKKATEKCDWNVPGVIRQVWATDYPHALRFYLHYWEPPCDPTHHMRFQAGAVVQDLRGLSRAFETISPPSDLSHNDHLSPILLNREHPLVQFLRTCGLSPRDWRNVASASRSLYLSLMPQIVWEEVKPIYENSLCRLDSAPGPGVFDGLGQSPTDLLTSLASAGPPSMSLMIELSVPLWILPTDHGLRLCLEKESPPKNMWDAGPLSDGVEARLASTSHQWLDRILREKFLSTRWGRRARAKQSNSFYAAGTIGCYSISTSNARVVAKAINETWVSIFTDNADMQTTSVQRQLISERKNARKAEGWPYFVWSFLYEVPSGRNAVLSEILHRLDPPVLEALLKFGVAEMNSDAVDPGYPEHLTKILFTTALARGDMPMPQWADNPTTRKTLAGLLDDKPATE